MQMLLKLLIKMQLLYIYIVFRKLVRLVHDPENGVPQSIVRKNSNDEAGESTRHPTFVKHGDRNLTLNDLGGDECCMQIEPARNLANPLALYIYIYIYGPCVCLCRLHSMFDAAICICM